MSAGEDGGLMDQTQGGTLDGLNAAQRLAVRHEGSPLIVLAGPGTGKTRVIIHRIADLVSRRGAEPESILAVTFTTRAAGELRERLAVQAGPGVAGRVRVHTFNALGQALVSRFGDLLGLPPMRVLIDKAQSARLLRRVILEHGLFAASHGAGLDSLVRDLLGVFEGMSNLSLLPEELEAAAGRDLEARRLAGPGSDPEAHAAGLAGAERLAEEARAFRLHTQERLARGWLTYGDQVALAIRLSRESAQARDIVRGETRHVIVDEFQDCNLAQLELLRGLIGPTPGNPSPDVCVVGDDDQAIYAFRGADDRAFARFRSVWRDAGVVRLEENYRSTPQIIAVANAVIARAEDRFEPDKRVVPPVGGGASGAAGGSVEAIRLTEHDADAGVIAAMIQAERAAKGTPWREFAVIARTGGDLDRAAAALRLESIPVDRRVDKRLIDEAGVMDVMAWMRWVLEPNATWHARRVLARPPFGLPADRLIELELEFAALRSREREAGVASADAYPAWAAARLVGTPEQAAAARAAELHGRLRAECATLRGDEAVLRIMDVTDPAHVELLPPRERARRVAALVTFLGIARDKQARLEPPADLGALCRHLDELIALGGLEPARGLEDAEPEEVESDGDDTGEGRVQLLTAHGAKGLEFGTVFLPRVAPAHGYPKTSGGNDRWKAPESLHGAWALGGSRPEADAKVDEERRVFYVACTRAMRRLVLLARGNKKPSKSTHFFEELTLTPPPGEVVVVREEAEVLTPRAGWRPSAGGGGGPGGAGPSEAAREAAERLRCESRVQVAAALERMSAPGVTPEDLAGARSAFEMATRRLAGAAALTRGEAIPGWMGEPDGALRALAARFAGAATEAARRSPTLRPLPAPLRLSFTAVDQWNRCAACYYLSRVMGLPDPDSPHQALGHAVHATLQAFFERWRGADAEGSTTPGLEELLRLGRRTLVQALGPRDPVRDEVMAQVEAQLRTAWSMHDPRAQILEIERSVTLDYEIDGVTHALSAKLDRLDQRPDGSYRIIDYKTGASRKALREPEADDLQLGIYALALRALQGGAAPGVAEYWILSTGDRGELDLAGVDEAGVREQIDRAARQMLAGEFPPSGDCKGPCRTLGLV